MCDHDMPERVGIERSQKRDQRTLGAPALKRVHEVDDHRLGIMWHTMARHSTRQTPAYQGAREFP